MTYSLAVKGARADSLPHAVSNHTVDDSVATPGGMAMAMRLGTPFLVKGPGGGQAYFTYDAERSTPDRPILVKV